MASEDEAKQAEKSPASGGSSDQNGRSLPGDSKSAEAAPAKAQVKGPSRLKKIWAATELDIFTVILLMKGGLPPAIALALLQIDVIAFHFTTLGYLVAIISILGMAIMPRAKFIQMLLQNLVLLCTGAAMALLVGYCATQARAHTSVVTAQSGREYNSSASAVSAIWLFFQVYVSNALRGKFPQLQLPVIVYSIFSVVACTTVPILPNMTSVISFVKRLLEAFLSGFAIATAVSFLVFPVTVRTIVIKQMTGYTGLLQKCLMSHQAYLTHLEDPANLEKTMVAGRNKDYKTSPQTAALRGTVAALTELHGKLQGDLPFAKREFAYGKLGPDELNAIMKHLRAIMLPAVGMSAMNDLLERLAFFHGWSQKHLDEGLNEEEKEVRAAVIKDWTENLKSLHGPFGSIIAVSCQGLQHVALQLQFNKPPKAAKKSAQDDVEAKGQVIKPGDPEFAAYLQGKIEDFSSGKREMLRHWSQRHGIKLSEDFFDTPRTDDFPFMGDTKWATSNTYRQNQRQLYLLLYMDFLLWSSAKAVLALVKYSDALVAKGVLSKSRVIMPGWKRIKKWLKHMLNSDEGPTEESREDIGDFNQTATMVNLGSAYNARKDPEHLPPKNALEKIGNFIRGIPGFLKSDSSSFGFRVAVATMSLAIVGYLRETQTWFQVHRALWAVIMTAISMTPSAGQSISGFIFRVLGTVIAMVVSFLCYYIPDEHRAGIIVFVWLSTAIAFWIPLKRPQFMVAGIISIVTNILILGYFLQVQKLGRELATSNGQEYLPIYELAPYRLATVCVGLAVAFIFTILPYPMTEHSLLRKNIGGGLYLLANYYSVVHESIQARVKDAEGDPHDKKSLGVRLTKLRTKVFTKQMMVLTNLRMFSAFQKFEIPIGGRFPKQQYDKIVLSIDRISRYISLLSYSSQSLNDDPASDHHLSQWSKDLKQVISKVGHTSHEITSLLALLSASMTNGQPLPPYLAAPQPFGLSQRLEEIDKDILSLRHIDEPEYAIFAVLQVASRCVIFELETLLRTVKELVGELDFSFHIVRTANSSETVLNDQEDPSSYPEGFKRKGD